LVTAGASSSSCHSKRKVFPWRPARWRKLWKVNVYGDAKRALLAVWDARHKELLNCTGRRIKGSGSEVSNAHNVYYVKSRTYINLMRQVIVLKFINPLHDRSRGSCMLRPPDTPHMLGV
jgi:hypothetical protein